MYSVTFYLAFYQILSGTLSDSLSDMLHSISDIYSALLSKILCYLAYCWGTAKVSGAFWVHVNCPEARISIFSSYSFSVFPKGIRCFSRWVKTKHLVILCYIYPTVLLNLHVHDSLNAMKSIFSCLNLPHLQKNPRLPSC